MSSSLQSSAHYRGRIAPTPTGYLHLGHARTFHTAWRRARQHKGTLILRNEDLDPHRCKPEFADAMVEDLRWLGIDWDEGIVCGGPDAPYAQSDARRLYVAAWQQLKDSGHIYPCTRSRKDVQEATRAPHEHAGDESQDEPCFPVEWRAPQGAENAFDAPGEGGVNWRFRVPDGRTVQFADGRCGEQRFVAGKDFGDFLVWRRDDVPAYELAVVVDDARMRITEVVRGEDLLRSTARQLLLYEALGWQAPAFYHCPLVCDAEGRRLAKRHASMSLRALRFQGRSPQEILLSAD